MPVPPPPQGGNTGRTIALVVGALVVVGALITGAVLLTSGGGGGDVADDGAHKLVAPQTVAAEFQKGAGGVTLSDSDVQDLEDIGVQDAQGVNATYASGDGLSKKTMNFAGVWGQVDDPGAVLDEAFDKIADSAAEDPTTDGGGTAELVGSPEEKTPAGFEGGVMKCQKIKFSAPAAADSPMKGFTIPFCMWADHSTVAWVASTDAQAVLSGSDPSLDDAASLTAKVRADTRFSA
jgi:hypothetical protein